MDASLTIAIILVVQEIRAHRERAEVRWQGRRVPPGLRALRYSDGEIGYEVRNSGDADAAPATAYETAAR